MRNKEALCPYCNQNKIIKKGKRTNKFEEVPIFQCKDCKKRFTLKIIKHKTYPAKIILNSISTYNVGYTQQQTSKIINQKYKLKVPQRTISEWFNQYKKFCPYNKLRKQAIKLYKPQNIIQTQKLEHTQPYTFKYHKAKLNILINKNPEFKALKNYLERINKKEFPHHIFTYNKSNNTDEQRASQLKFNCLSIRKNQKNNLANRLAGLALSLATANKQRHQTIQNFMLINDSTTIATEIPIYLTKNDIKYFKERKFEIELEDYRTPVTGHIDILQIRNNLIHILDYKPEADKANPVNQLTIYALALASRTKLAVKDVKAAWFDEKDYFEFYPLHAVYPKC